MNNLSMFPDHERFGLRQIKPPPPTVPVEDIPGEITRLLVNVEKEGRIWMNTRETQPQIFSDPRLLDTMRNLREARGVRFRVVTGPIIQTADGENGLLQLYKDEVLDAMVHKNSLGAENLQVIVETPPTYPNGSPRAYDWFEYSHGSMRNRDYEIEAQWHGYAVLEVARLETDYLGPEPRLTSTIRRPYLASGQLIGALRRELHKESPESFFNIKLIEDIIKLPSGHLLQQPQAPA